MHVRAVDADDGAGSRACNAAHLDSTIASIWDDEFGGNDHRVHGNCSKLYISTYC